MREYEPNLGFALNGLTFLQHLASGCEQCKRYDPDKPATAALCCLDGSILLKQQEVKHVERDTRPVSKFYGTKAQVKAAMRYK